MKFSLQNAWRLALLAFAPALAACPAADSISEHGAASPASAAEMALMARHDSLMAKEDALFALKGQLTKAHSPAAGPYLRGLAAADAAMMDWMHRYHAPDSTATPAARLAYFQQQQQVLAGVNRQFVATMDSASLFIKTLPPTSPAAAPTSPK